MHLQDYRMLSKISVGWDLMLLPQTFANMHFTVPQLKEYETQNRQSNSVETSSWTDTPSPSMTESSFCNVSFPVTFCVC